MEGAYGALIKPMGRHVRRQTSKGVTLVELMVVIAVVAILAAVAMPSYRELMDNYRVRKAAEDVVSLISNARSGAVKLHREVNVSFTAGANWCVGAISADEPEDGDQAAGADPCSCGTSGDCTVDGEEVVIPPMKHPGVTLGSASSAFVFDGVTGATTPLVVANPRTITLHSPLNKFTATVTVTPLGQANLVIGPKTN